MAHYFQDAKGFTINGGTFGDDHSRHTTYRGPVYRTNDRSTHTTNYDGYVNHGQHASGRGTINNHGPQTTNNGPVYDYQQYAGSRDGNRRSPRPPSPPGFNAHPIRPGQQNRRRYPSQNPPFDTNPTYGHDGDDDDDDDEFSSDEHEYEPKLPPPRRAQQPTAPTRRPQDKRPGNRGEPLIEQLKTLSPEMQQYIKLMQQRKMRPTPPVRPESELQDRMADMQLDDDGPSRPPAGRSSPHVRGPQNPRSSARTRGPRVAEPYRDNSPGDETDSDDSDEDGALHGRAVINSTDSNNVNSTTVVDSHNDNSTRTEITKGYGSMSSAITS